MSETFERVFSRVFIRACAGPEFSARRFFAQWYGERRNAHFFLFKKNLKVTNIQYSELVALVRSFTVEGDGDTRGNLQILSRREFNAAIAGMVAALRANTPTDTANRMLQLYGDILQHLVIVEPYFSSCNVFLPPGLSLKAEAVCAQSGYIHSCGRNIWTRNTRKAEPAEFFRNLKRYLRTRRGARLPLYFSVYAHEDFSRYDRDDEAPQDGLDDVKLYVEKFFLGDESLVSVLQRMRDAFGDHLVTPSPGDYRVRRSELQRGTLVDRSRSLWLIVDRSIAADGRRPGDTQYFICYEQKCKNENPFHLFDENKPAWVSHTTIPHTLMGALINITRPDWPEGEVRFADPFVGTGTSVLELCKEPRVEVAGSDISTMTSLMFEDNAALFGASRTELKRLRREVRRLKRLLEHVSAGGSEAVEDELLKGYEEASDFVLAYREEGELEAVDFDERAEEALRGRTREGRLLVYLALRALIRSGLAFRRESRDWWSASGKECAEWLKQLEALIRLRERQSASGRSVGERIVKYEGNYSDACSIDPDAVRTCVARHRESASVVVRDARELRARTCDVVVTDPPYGFNTSDDPVALATLYKEMVSVLIRAVLPHGQLVVCLPEQSYSGRKLRFFTLRELVTHQVLFAANQENADVIITGQALPEPTSLFRPPYYWESARALRRSILHFRIREREARDIRGQRPTSPDRAYPSLQRMASLARAGRF